MGAVDNPDDTMEARTLLWMSSVTQARLQETVLLVIGCGGTGSLLAVNAAFVGFRQIVVCDADALEPSNLNRFVYAKPADVGRLKAEIVVDYIRERVPGASVRVIPHAFPNRGTLDLLTGPSTTVAGCVDDTRIRVELDIACRHFGCTLVDLGTSFQRKDGQIVSSGGQVLISRPAGPCLMCLGFTRLLDENHYLVGPDDSPQPSLLLLNQVVSALAVECLMNEAIGAPNEANVVGYSRSQMHASLSTLEGHPECMICGDASARHVASIMPELAQAGEGHAELRGPAR